MPKAALKCRNRHFSAAFMRMDSFKREFGRQERCGFCESGRLSMATPKSRTYRLHLSEEGTDAFLECHSRLARIARRFIPYGATLTVAMLLIEALDGPELCDELSAPAVIRLTGRIEHFVGASPDLAHAAARMIEHLAASGDSGSAVSITRLYTTAIALMSASEDSEIARAYRRMETAFTLQIR
jgi:hypothetical protein